MAMYNPPHPGEFITEVYREPNSISGRELAEKLDVAAFSLRRILGAAAGLPRKCRFVFQGTGSISRELARHAGPPRLVGRSPACGP